MKKILILTDIGFSQRDYNRFGVEILKKNFEVNILDFTEWFSPEYWKAYTEKTYQCEGYKKISDIESFEKIKIIDRRNINFEAIGGGLDGQFNIKATRVATIDAPDIRFQGEKILIKSDNTINIISKGFLELKSGFTLSASFADDDFGTMAQVLKSATTINPPTI